MKKYTQDEFDKKVIQDVDGDESSIKAMQHLAFVNTGSKMKRLSKAQYKIFELAAQGLSNKQIAKLLLKSEHTIKTQLKRIIKQTGIGCRGAFWMYLPVEQRIGLGNDRKAMALMPVEKARNKIGVTE
jgi:DNA-binding NarL/FixJ family response regulator